MTSFIPTIWTILAIILLLCAIMAILWFIFPIEAEHPPFPKKEMKP